MAILTTVKDLSFDDALAAVEDDGAAFVDLRPIDAYLDVHIPGSLALLYEFGPGMASRARDCIPLELPLVLLDLGYGDITNAAAALRGKGFSVLGAVTDAINAWAHARGNPASTDVHEGPDAPNGTVLDVGDPGANAPDGALRIPADTLFRRLDEVKGNGRVIIAAGYGVRAALAVGALERAGVDDIVFWRTRRR